MTADTPKVLVAMSNFKGSLSNLEACESISKALTQLKIQHSIAPVGDGGSGTGLSLHYALGGEFVGINSVGPRGSLVEANVLCFPKGHNPNTVYIDSSSVCGYTLVPENEKNAMEASSRGLGRLLIEVAQRWPTSLKEIWIGLGDSAISDMGIGMLAEMGVVFIDTQGNRLLPNTRNLINIADFSKPTVQFGNISLKVLCDVQNPVCGPQGSALIFSPQKGASKEETFLIARGMDNFATRIEHKFHRSLKYIPMTGSAGGLAAAMYSFFNAELVPGCDFLLDQIGFNEKIRSHDFIVTGEGKTDLQTLKRKAPAVVAHRAKDSNKRCLIISGAVSGGTEQIKSELKIFGIYASGKDPSASQALTQKAQEVFSDLSFD